MKIRWIGYLPPFLRWRAIYWAQHLRIMWLKHRNPAPDLAGIRIPVMQALSDNICAAIYDGYYESAELSTFKTKLDKSDTVLEIGAGIGFLSSYCASQIGSENVFAYEANPQLEPLIRSVYSANGVHPNLKLGVLGERVGQAKFYVTMDFWASSLSRPLAPCKELMVPIYPLNEEILRINPTFLLMDIEGGEYDLIKSIDFHTIRKISIELHTDVLGQARIDEIKSIMKEADFLIDDNLSRVISGVKEVLFLERETQLPTLVP